MSRPILPNSPLAQVSCELRFHGKLSLFSCWGAIQDDLRDRYPHLYVPLASIGTPSLLQPLKLSAEDKKSSILLAINSIAYSTVEYTGFSDFNSEMWRVFEIFLRHSRVSSFTHLEMRYINRLPPMLNDDHARGFVLHPALKLSVGGIDAEQTSQPQFVAEVIKDGINFRIALVSPEENFENEYSSTDTPILQGIHLDLVGYINRNVTDKSLSQDLVRVHTVIEDGFFSMITDQYLSYLKGESDVG